ncbi:ATP-binding protein (plasmid) [Rhodococcus pseudokoreensis]|uniref:ATP-binding protein n=2 Tax=Rhodococcus pseudokoreensis TaxID=2811421 RepID=A0A974ZS22_9NOCA|nr:ATP-binding protein [Rhodococcus pseudokoreensis]
MRTAASSAVGWDNTDRILRMFARFTSVGYLAYLILLLPSITLMQPRMAPWWTPLAVVTVFGTGLLPGIVSLRPHATVMRMTAAAAAVTFLAAAGSWPLAWRGPQLPADDGVWLAAFPGLASLAGIVAWPTTIAFAHLVTGCVLVQMINLVARQDASAAMLLPEIAFAIMFCTLFVGGAAMALRTGRVLDATTEATHTAASAAAAQHARTVERERFDALVHDGVMATLLASSRAQPLRLVRTLATTTLQELDALRTGITSDHPFTPAEALAHLRAAAAAADAGAEFTATGGETGEPASLPAETVRAMGAALGEAIRNSRLHAGPGAARTVTVAVESDRLKVRVVDDGAGFDRTAVPAHRLGITVSILARMRQTPGGSARIDTRPGRGTTVHLDWAAR